MNKPMHTPGPWVTGDGYSAHKTTVFFNRKLARVVARCETEEDARLIAAAPELLAALQDLLAAIPKYDRNFDCAEVALARATIAKATSK